MNTLENIVSILENAGLDAWRLSEERNESAELFFVKKQLDTRRIKDTHKYKVTVFRNGDANGKKLRAATDAEILSFDTKEEIEKKLKDAYFAAQFAMNPYYDLPDPEKSETIRKTGELAEKPLAESAGKMAKAIFDADTDEKAFVNSAEIFAERSFVRIVTSWGTDVSYTDANLNGEFVVQCKEPEDVEMHNTFRYDACSEKALFDQVKKALTFVSDRAHAKKVLKSAKYDVVLCAKHVAEVLSYYAARSSARMIFPHYSTWQPGDQVQGDEIVGETMQMKLLKTVPFSHEGIRMEDLPLIKDGKMLAIHGPSSFCRWLGIKPTGDYSKILCENKGTMSFDEMQKKPCLVVVTFSDFQMDDFSGHFGGEIRLAYLVDEDKVTPVTGGSVNGSLIDAQKEIVFSTDRFESASYEGPYAMRLKDVSVAGVE